MSFGFVGAVAAVLLYWAWLAVVFTGLGRVVCRLVGLRAENAGRDLFWMGWALVLGALQLWHLWFRVGLPIFALLSAGGLAGWLMAFGARRPLRLLSRSAWAAGAGWIGMAAAVLAAVCSLSPTLNYDAGLYHMPTVQWLRTYPIVKGLGNLHERLAYNDVYFLYAAFLGWGPWSLKSAHLAGGLLLWVALCEGLTGLGAMLRRGERSLGTCLAALLTVPLSVTILGHEMSSLSPDVVILAISAVLAVRLADVASRSGGSGRNASLFVIVVLSCAGVMVRMNFAAAAAPSLLIALAAWWRGGWEADTPSRRRLAWSGMLAGVLLLGPWLVRGMLLTGYIGFPSTVLAFDVPWRVPASLALSLQKWILSWARAPLHPWVDVLGHWGWLHAWVARLQAAVLVPAALAALTALTLAWRVWRGHCRVPWLAAGAVLPWAASLLVWFFTAPDPRFTGGAIWILAAALAALAVAAVGRVGGAPDEAREPAGAARSAQAAVGAFAVAGAIVAGCTGLPCVDAAAGFPKVGNVYYTVQKTDSGLTVYVPFATDQCWNLTLPCTPYFRRNLRLLDPRNPAGGFVLDPSVTCADMHGDSPGFRGEGGVGVVPIMGDWDPYTPEGGAAPRGQCGRLLVYAGRAGRALLRLEVMPWNDGRDRQVEVWCEREVAARCEVKAGGIASAPLELQRGFQVVTLCWAGGPPAAVRSLTLQGISP